MEPSKERSQGIRKMFRRIEEVKEEFFKIQWTEECPVSMYAKVVVLATFVCGMLLYISDLVVQRMLSLVNGMLKILFG